MKEKVFIISLLAVGLFLLSVFPAVFVSADQSLSMTGSQWAVYEQNTLPNGNLHFYPADRATTIPSGGVQFAIPDASGNSPTYVNLLLNTFSVSLTEANVLSVQFNVVTSSGTTAFFGNPDGGNPAVSFVRLYIQSNLPQDGSATCGVGRKNVLNYWWDESASYTFVTGGTTSTVTLTTSLNPSNWSGICGNSAGANPAGFDSSLAKTTLIGLSFGSNFFFSNGMGVDGTTGSATFQMLSYTIS